MPKNKVSDPITDQEIAFGRLVLSGGMTDRQAAEAVGLNPDSAAYTKSKPRVRDYMLQHRAAVQQQLAQHEADGLRRLNLDREQVLNRLWEIANLSPDMTRGSITGQVKALAVIVAMENLIPDRRAASSENKSAPPPVHAEIYASAWRRQQATAPATTNDPQPIPAPGHQEAQNQGGPGASTRPGAPRSVPGKPKPAANSSVAAPLSPDPSQPTFANRFSPSQAPEPYVPLFGSVPDLRIPFSIKKNPVNPFVRPR
jgi:hypothetical protein